MRYELILGNKNYAPWSLRAWLTMRPFGIAFEERVVEVYSDDFEALKVDCFPARQVPVLKISDGNTVSTIWDSLAIAEFMAEQFPDRGHWPSDPIVRARARAVVAEVHCGFRALRSSMPMNLRRTYATFVPSNEAQADIHRIAELWRWTGAGAHGLRYIFGDVFTIADAFFVPIAFRFKTYGVKLDDDLQHYADTLMAHRDAVEYRAAALGETWIMAHNEFDID